jgi:hypothetical protein
MVVLRTTRGWRTAATRGGQRVAVALLVALGTFGGAAECRAQAGLQAAEYRVKAAYLYKFCGFVEWPARAFARPDRAFTIGVMGADTLAYELEQVVAERTVNARPVAVRKLKRGESIANVQMLFVGRSEAGRLAEILASAKGQATLVVTESENALALGSMINFVVVDDKVRFDVALPPAEEGELRISARLLAVARKVVTGPS